MELFLFLTNVFRTPQSLWQEAWVDGGHFIAKIGNPEKKILPEFQI